MRVLWWTMEYPPDQGGIATMSAHVAEELVARGHEVCVVVHGRDEGTAEVAGVRVVRLPTQRVMLDGDRAGITAVRRQVAVLKRSFRADLYHFHPSDSSGVLHRTTSSSHPAPTLVTLHSAALVRTGGARPGSLLAALLEEAEVITAVASGARDDLTVHRPDLADRSLVVPNGVPVPVAADGGAAPEPPPEGPVVVAVGRLSAEKALDRAVAAMATVVATVPGARLVIAGEGERRAEIEAQIGRLDLEEAVTLVGHRPRREVPGLLAGARALVLPSALEGLPMVGLEAGLAGRPVVGSRIPGVTDLVLDGVTGLLVDPGDVDALAAGIVRVLTEPGLAARLGAAAHARVCHSFSLAQMVDGYERAYRVALRRAGGPGRQGTVAAGRPPASPSPRVSVVIAAWNAARTIGASIGSVLAQTERAVEVLVVDDGSDDDTAAVARRAADGDPRVTVVGQPRGGQGVARNAALALATGDFVGYLDADDLWPPDRLAQLLAPFAGDPDLEATFGRATAFADPDDPPPPGTLVSGEAQPARLPTTMLIRADAQRRRGPFDADGRASGMAWVVEALDAGLRYACVDAVVLERRIHGQNLGIVTPEPAAKLRLAALKASLDRRRAAEPTG